MNHIFSACLMRLSIWSGFLSFPVSESSPRNRVFFGSAFPSFELQILAAIARSIPGSPMLKPLVILAYTS